MGNPMVVDLNLRSTMARQKGKCLQCKKPLSDNVYFRMDQTLRPEIYEVYCEVCGIEQEKLDKNNHV